MTIAGPALTPFQADVLRVLKALRVGEVVSYSEVAAQAGFPGAARAVGNLLREVDGCPWWRVVTATGRLVPGKEREQGARLRAEGVRVRSGRVVAGAGEVGGIRASPGPKAAPATGGKKVS